MVNCSVIQPQSFSHYQSVTVTMIQYLLSHSE